MPEFIFPKPSGKYAVGTKLFELTDSTRNDFETGKPRELVVQAWYPAEGKPLGATAPYAYEAREWYKSMFSQQGVEAEKLKLLEGIRTHAIPGATICNEHAPYPVVIFCHGNGASRGGYSFLCEEIASHGYVVLMVMHTYITFLTKFTDGREIKTMRDTDLCSKVEECFTDIEFMLTRVQAGAFGALTTFCDFNNIGILGHSLGGMVTAQVCRRDKRIKAGINLDGTLWGKDSTKPFYKPFLYLRTPNFYADMSGILEQQKDSLGAVGVTKENFIGSVERFCHENGKDTMQIVVEGANHLTFMDGPIINDFFAKIFKNERNVTTLDAHNNLPLPEILDVISKCIMTFLNEQLKGQAAAYPSQVQHDKDAEVFDFYIPDHHPKHKKIELGFALLDAYVGNYAFGPMALTITRDDNTLWAQMAGQAAYPIYPESETTFFYTVTDRQMSFVKDKSGKVVQLILHQVGNDMVGKKIGLMVDVKKLDEAIEVVPYNSEWPQWFEHEAKAIMEVFSTGRVLTIEHYGSTAVPGLCAKPIVDLLVGLNEFKLTVEEIKKLEALGYEFVGQIHPSVERFFLRKRGTKNFNLGVVKFDSQDWHNNLVTRDYLRTYPDEVKKYADIKNAAVKQGLKTLIEYHKYKDEFVNGLRKRALEWKKCQKSA